MTSLFEGELIDGMLNEPETYQTDIADDDLFFLCNDSKLFPRETGKGGIYGVSRGPVYSNGD